LRLRVIGEVPSWVTDHLADELATSGAADGLEITADPVAGMQNSAVLVNLPGLVPLGAGADVEAEAARYLTMAEADVEAGVPTVVVNASTIATGTRTGDDLRDWVIDAHRMAIACVRHSMKTGSSVLDADRLVAEPGAATMLTDDAELTGDASHLLATELARILAEVGAASSRRSVMHLPRMPNGITEVVLTRWDPEPGAQLADGAVLGEARIVVMHMQQRSLSTWNVVLGHDAPDGRILVEYDDGALLDVVNDRAGRLVEVAVSVGDRLTGGAALAVVEPDDGAMATCSVVYRP
jgi:hypothetical protein